MLRRSLANIEAQADRIAAAIMKSCATAGSSSSACIADVATTDGFSQMGSGSLPTQDLRTRLVAIEPKILQAGELAARLRQNSPPVFTRVHKGQVLIDPRTLQEGEEQVLIEAVVQALKAKGTSL
jgi:seryl-tRNA(Sec) selenium transferase